MSIILVCCILLTTAYALLMIIYRIGWSRQTAFYVAGDFLPQTHISVIIPARNEEANIEACLRSILAQQYPAALLEVIVVNDHSEDRTAELASGFGNGVIVVDLEKVLSGSKAFNSYKKMALTAGIARSRGELVVTTDADCIAASPHWLLNIAALYEQKSAAMIIGPVAFTAKAQLVDIFQSLDFTSMQGITAAAHRLGLGSMANGANLAFSRAAFDAVAGYAGIDSLASGDDFLLLHKMQQRFPEAIHYLKAQEAIICTSPQPTWAAFLQQRIRWASKSGKYTDHRLTAILLLVYLFNIVVAAAGIVSVWLPALRGCFAGMLLVKIVCELAFLLPVSRFFRNVRGLWLFPLLQPLHILYIILAGFFGMIGNYSWKGRNVK